MPILILFARLLQTIQIFFRLLAVIIVIGFSNVLCFLQIIYLYTSPWDSTYNLKRKLNFLGSHPLFSLVYLYIIFDIIKWWMCITESVGKFIIIYVSLKVVLSSFNMCSITSFSFSQTLSGYWKSDFLLQTIG